MNKYFEVGLRIDKCLATTQQNGVADKRSNAIGKDRLPKDMNQMFLAHARSKKLKDEINIRENQIMDSFLAYAGCEAIMKITVIV